MNNRYFNKLNLQSLYFEVSNVITMSDAEINELIKKFNQYGFVILRCNENLNFLENNLFALSNIFGNIKNHPRSKETGITIISTEEGTQEQYIATTNHEHPIHTDSPFDENPPKIIALHCERQSEIGGESLIVSSCLVWEHLYKTCPYALKYMFQQDAFTCSRDKNKATIPIFKYENGTLRMAYRFDYIIEVSVLQQIEDAFYNVIKKFITDNNNQIVFKLKPGEILISDNTATLHGRSAFEGDRKLNRLWFENDSKLFKDRIQLGFSPLNVESNLFLEQIISNV